MINEVKFNEIKFKSQICTNVEQSSRLLELGLKPETADMEIEIFKGDNSISGYVQKGYWETEISEELVEFIPAWSLHRLIELYKDVEDTSLWSLENVNYNRLIQCISLAIKHGAFNKEYLKQ